MPKLDWDDKQKDHDPLSGPIPDEVIMVLRKIIQHLEMVDKDILERSKHGKNF